jgi:hypothetical protein
MKKLALLVVLTFGLSALAVQQLDLNLSGRLLALTSGILISPTSLMTSDAKINANRITRSLAGSATIDFVAGTIICTDSAAITVTGARTGDACDVGLPAAPAANSSFTCFVSASDAVKVRHCPAGTAIDPASAVYNVRITSNQ